MINQKNMREFSSIRRQDHLDRLQSDVFDILIIGGGATGCGIALDAASRRLSTALIEKRDFASGTSSKSTKLIHGGLRYLKQLEFGLVRETGTERAIVHKLAPHLVQPEKMLLPIIENGTYTKLAASVGVKVYDIMAGVRKSDRRKMLSKEDTLKKEPLLDASVLKGSCYFAEYRTDDARLTIELIKSAAQHGALALNYTTAQDFIYQDAKVKGVHAIDELTGRVFTIRAKQVVSASGPWVDGLRSKNNSLSGKRLHLTKGVHIVLPHDKLPLRQSVYFDVPDGRMIFAIPRGRATYIGTTDTTYTASIDHVIATRKDADYLLAAVKHAFPSVNVSIDDVESNWAGLRPLIHEDGKSPSELSRKDEIFTSSSDLISIAGGKLTGYRKMGQRIVDLVIKKLDKDAVSCKTKTLALTQSPYQNVDEVNERIIEMKKRVQAIGLDEYYGWYLITTYGEQSVMIVDRMSHFKDQAQVALVRAELWYCVHYEMVNRSVDFFIRRTGRLYFDIQSVKAYHQQVRLDLANYLDWNQRIIDADRKELEEVIFDASHYYHEDIVMAEEVS